MFCWMPKIMTSFSGQCEKLIIIEYIVKMQRNMIYNNISAWKKNWNDKTQAWISLKRHKNSYISRGIIHRNSYRLSKFVMSSKIPRKMLSFTIKRTLAFLDILVAFSTVTFFGYTTNALETFLMSSTMLKSSILTIENCPSASCLQNKRT